MNTIYLTCPIHNFAVRRIHVTPQKVGRNMLSPGKFVASRSTHRRWTGGTALLSQRRGLFSEAEGPNVPLNYSSTSLLPSERRYPVAFCGSNRAESTGYQCPESLHNLNRVKHKVCMCGTV